MKRVLFVVLVMCVALGPAFASGTKDAGGANAWESVKWSPIRDRVIADNYILPQGAKEAIAAEGTKKIVVYNWGDLEFDPVKFPDPQAMVEQLHARGFRVTLWVPPPVSLM